MKILRLLSIATLVCLLGMSCSEEYNCEEGIIESPNAVTPINGAAYTSSLLDCRLDKIQTFTLQGFEGGQVVGINGGAIQIPPQSIFDSDGQIIDGLVDVRLLEMFTPGEVIACQLSTNTRNAQQTIEPNLSEGLLYFDILFNGEPVVINGEIVVFIPSDTNVDQRTFFNSPDCPELDCLVTWGNGINPEAFPFEIFGNSGELIIGYAGFGFEAGWFNIGQFTQDTNDRTTVYNVSPSGFDNTNSNVFLKYDSDLIAVSLFENFDQSLGVFTETYGEIPLQTQGDIIFVSNNNGEFLLDNTPVSITQDLIGVTVTIQNLSEAQLITTINSL